MTLIKICGAVVFIAAVLTGVGVLSTKTVFYYVAIVLSAVAFVIVLLSALPWRRKPSRYH